jgi:hypothetical protein
MMGLSNGSCYLMNKAFMGAPNMKGTRGWYLTLLTNGALCGNGAPETAAEWTFVDSQRPNHISPSNGASDAARAHPHAHMARTFPGLAAGKDELMKYFATLAGQEFLAQSEYSAANNLYMNGTLSKILHRPDWPYLASRFHDYSSDSYFPPSFNQALVNQVTTHDLLKQFFDLGWTTVSNVVSLDVIASAKKVLHYWQFKYMNHIGPSFPHPNGLKRNRGYIVEYCGDIGHDMDLLALYYTSSLPHIMQQLMGINEISHPKFCRPVSIFPSFDLTESPALYGDKWTIEGFTSDGDHSPYNILVGVVLTDVKDIDQVS